MTSDDRALVQALRNTARYLEHGSNQDASRVANLRAAASRLEALATRGESLETEVKSLDREADSLSRELKNAEWRR